MKSKKIKRIAALLLTAVMLLDIGSGNTLVSVAADNDITVQSDAGVEESAGVQVQAEGQTEETLKQGETTESAGTETPETSTTPETTEDEETTVTTPADEESQTTEPEQEQPGDAAETQQTAEPAQEAAAPVEEETEAETAEADAANAAEARADYLQNVYGRPLTEQKWNSLKNAADADTWGTGEWRQTINGESHTFTNVPVTSWRRSEGYVPVSRVSTSENGQPWNWETVSGLDLKLGGEVNSTKPDETSKNMEKVWDGSRQESHNFNHVDYLDSNVVTADWNNTTLYDSATWTKPSDVAEGGSQEALYRFQATVNLGKEYDPTADTFTLVPVTGDDEIFINDDMFVFVYPENVELSIDPNSPDYFANYLAFWTGTDNKDGKIMFYGHQGTEAKQVSLNGMNKLTNGWYVAAVQDNVGQSITYGYLTHNGDTGYTGEYKIDIFTGEYATGGGMFRVKLGQEKNVKHEVSFPKVSEGTNTPVSGAGFQLYQDYDWYTGEVSNPYGIAFRSDENGTVSFKVPAGTYYMKETVTPTGYEPLDTVWEVVVREDRSFTITALDRSGNPANPKNPVITNEPNGTQITLTKVNTKDEGLQGATFSVKDSSGNDVTTATSGNDGVISLVLKPGTYTMTETAAPTGYVLPTGVTWSLTVTANGDATVSCEEHSEYVNNNKLVNFTESEESAKNLTLDKVATPTGNDGRTFNITLTASGYNQEPGTQGSDASVVLVLDRSGSMKDDYGTLQTAANNFITALAGESKTSKVAVVTFADYATENSELRTLDAEGVSYLQGRINSTYAGGGTNTGAAMETAKRILDGDTTSGNKKYVVLFSDGVPDTSIMIWDTSSETAGTAYTAATTMKNSGVTIYAIGYGNVSSTTFNWYKGDGNPHESTSVNGGDFLTDLASSGKYSYADPSTLNQIFQDIAGDIGEQNPLTDVTIMDTIDPRFELTEESKRALIADDAKVSDPDANGVVTITWENQTVGTGDSDWEKIITVKAKDDFLGGNYIPTNGEGSGVWLDPTSEMTKAFPKPVVNVKLLESVLEDGELTVFVEDEVNTREYLKEWMEQLQPYITLATGETDEEKLNAVVNELFTDGSVEVRYAYPMKTDDEIGNITLTLTEAPVPENSFNAKVTDNEKEYTLTMTYTPDPLANRQNSLDNPTGTYNPVQGAEITQPSTSDATHTLHVVWGSVTVEKNIRGNIDFDKGDGIFTFKLTNTSTGKSYYETIRIKAGDATPAEVKFDTLPRGVYEIEELDTMGFDEGTFTLTPDNTNGTPCTILGTNRFVIGLKEGTTNIVADNYDNLARDGKAEITNTVDQETPDTSNDVIVNNFTIDSNGNIKITPDLKDEPAGSNK